MFKVTITELPNGAEESSIVRYEQTVDILDMNAVINAVNTSTPMRQRALRSDAGKPKVKVSG